MTNNSFQQDDQVFNSTARLQGRSFSLSLQSSTSIICGILLSLIVFFGVIGNTVVVTILRRELKEKMVITYLLVTQLCIADLLGCVLDMPLLFLQFVFSVEGKILHIISDMNFVVCSAISLLNCVIINLLSVSRRDAFHILRDPLLTVPRLKIILPIVWTSCVSLSVILGLAALSTGRKQWYLQCTTGTSNLGASIIDIGSGIVSVLCVVGTFLNITTSFCSTLRKIKAHNAMLQRSMIQSRLVLERKMSLSAMVLTTTFLVSWTPWLIVRTLHLLYAEAQADMGAVVTVIIGFNHCINPFVYAATITELRQKMMQFLKICPKCPCGISVVQNTVNIRSRRIIHPDKSQRDGPSKTKAIPSLELS